VRRFSAAAATVSIPEPDFSPAEFELDTAAGQRPVSLAKTGLEIENSAETRT